MSHVPNRLFKVPLALPTPAFPQQVTTDPSTKGSGLRLSSLFRRPSPAFGALADKHVEVRAAGGEGPAGLGGPAGQAD